MDSFDLTPCCIGKKIDDLIAKGGTHAAFSHSDWGLYELMDKLLVRGRGDVLTLAMTVYSERINKRLHDAMTSDSVSKLFLLVPSGPHCHSLRLLKERFPNRVHTGVYPVASTLFSLQGRVLLTGNINPERVPAGAPLRLLTVSVDTAFSAVLESVVKSKIRLFSL